MDKTVHNAPNKGLGYAGYRKFFEDNKFPAIYDEKEEEFSDLVNKLLSYASSGDFFGQPFSYVQKGCISMIKKLLDLRKSVYVKEDLDAFEEQVKEWLEQLNSYKQGKFPIKIDDIDKKSIDRSLIYYG